MNNSVFPDITCPFFHHAGRCGSEYTLVCEGIIGSERKKFISRKERRKYITAHCDKNGCDCKLAEIKYNE